MGVLSWIGLLAVLVVLGVLAWDVYYMANTQLGRGSLHGRYGTILLPPIIAIMLAGIFMMILGIIFGIITFPFRKNQKK